MFSNLFSGKSWFQSLTGWGVVLLGTVHAAEQAGLVAPGTSVMSNQAAQGATDLVSQAGAVASAAGALATALGVRKAAGSK